MRSAARRELEAVLAADGVVAVSAYPSLARTARRMAAEGLLRSLAPGVFCAWQVATDPLIRARAVSAWIPDGVVTGRAAAQLTFWPELAVPVVTVSTPGCHGSRPGFEVTRERLDPELVVEVHGVRVTNPALTALDLTSELGGDGIDRVLRLRVVRLADLAEALRLTPRRTGNRSRRQFLLDSRDEPWSAAERAAHRLLHTARITGWRANLPVLCGSRRYYLDVGFEALRLGIEVDGHEVHRAENVEQFIHDRRKWSRLHNAGWGLLHFAAVDVLGEGEWFLEAVRTAIRARGR